MRGRTSAWQRHGRHHRPIDHVVDLLRQGTDLGLAIVQDIVDRHHGHIRVDGVEPHGTTIVVEFATPFEAPPR